MISTPSPFASKTSRMGMIRNGGQKRQGFTCRSKSVFQMYDFIPVDNEIINDCLEVCNTSKTMTFKDKVDYSSSLGVNIVNVYKYKTFVESMNALYKDDIKNNYFKNLIDEMIRSKKNN